MSVYCTRFYEVYTEIIDEYVPYNVDIDEKAKEIENPKDGYTLKSHAYGEYPFRIYNEKKGVWEKKKECKRKWVLSKWYNTPTYGYSPNSFHIEVGKVFLPTEDDSDRTPLAKVGDRLQEEISYCDNGGVIRDDYISTRNWGDTGVEFDGRGFPDDLSDELKEEFSKKGALEYCWDKTYVTVKEWSHAFSIRFEKFKNELNNRMVNNEFRGVNEKLDLLLNKVFDPTFEKPKKKRKKKGEEECDESLDYEDTVNYMWEEDFWDLMTIRREIARAYDFTENFGWNSEENIRIIYYLS